MRSLGALILVVLLSFASFAGRANSFDTIAQNEVKIHELTDRIVACELDILKLNTAFRIESSYQTKSRTIRQFLYNLAASGVSLGATTTIMAHRWSTNRPDGGTLQAGAIGLVVGQAIVDGGIAIEYGIDKLKDYQARKCGLSPGIVREKIQNMKVSLDSLLKERRDLISQLSAINPKKRKSMELESEVLEDVRDLALVEFARFFSDQHKVKTSRNVSYINGLLATGAGGYGGSLIGLLAVTDKDPKLAVPAGIGFITSSAIVMVSPITNKLFSRWSKKRTSKDIRKSLGELSNESVSDLNHDLNLLSVSVNFTPTNDRQRHISDRLAVYAAELDMLTQQVNREGNKKEKAATLFKDRLVSNNIIAAAKMTWGIMLIQAGSKHHDEPKTFNRRIAQAATVYTVGQSAWVGDTLLAGKRPKALKFPIGGQIRLPVERLEKRIERLNDIEQLLVKTKD